MSKLAMEVLTSDKPTVADLRKKIAETENSLWYSNNQNLSKYAGGTVMDGATGASLLPRGGTANLVEPQVIGKVNATEFALTVGREDTEEIGVETRTRLLLQTQNKQNLQRKKRRKRRREARRKRLKRWKYLKLGHRQRCQSQIQNLRVR